MLLLLCGTVLFAQADSTDTDTGTDPDPDPTEDCRVTTGIITSANGLRIDTVSVDGEPAANTITVVATYEVFVKKAVVLADENYEIIRTFEDSDSVDFTNYAPGKYNIFLVTYTGDWNMSIPAGTSVYVAKYSNECWVISNNEIIITATGQADGDDGDDGEMDPADFQPLPCDTIVSTGFVFFPDGRQIDTFDVSDGQPDIIDVTPTTYSVNPGASAAVILTDREYNIVEVFPDTTSFDLDTFGSDKYNVFLLTYTGNLNEDIDGQSVYTAKYTDACWLISNNELIIYARAETDCNRFVTTGIITNRDGERIDTLIVGDGVTDGFLIVPTYEVLAETAVIVADENYEVLETYPNTRQVDFEGEGYGPGKYNIFLVTFTGTFNDSIAIGSSVYTVTYSSACYVISNNELILYAEAPESTDTDTDGGDDGEDGGSEGGESDSTSGRVAIDMDVYQAGQGGDLQITINSDNVDHSSVSAITLRDGFGRVLNSTSVSGRSAVIMPTNQVGTGIYVVTAQTADGLVSKQVFLR